MKHILSAGQGEALKLDSPVPGTIVVTLDPRRGGGAFASGVWTLQRGQAIPPHRHVQHDEVWFVHKGQGRAVVAGEQRTVVPGASIVIPRQAQHELRNTGTGVLQLAWAAAPAGLEQWYREHAAPGTRAGAAATQEPAGRVGVEGAGAAPGLEGQPTKQGRRRRGRRGGRGRRGHGPRQTGPPQGGSTPASRAGTPPPSASAASPSGPGAPLAAQRAPRADRTPQRGGRPPPRPERAAPRPERRGGRRGRGRVKVVYMGGRWVEVRGDGPVISTGGEGE